MRLSIRHLTTYAYEPPAGRGVMRLRLFPPTYDTQRVEDWRVSVDEDAVPAGLTDAAAVTEAIWTGEAPIASLAVIAEGTVARDEDNGVVRGLPERMPPGVYLRDTTLTRADEAVRTLGEEARQSDPLSTLHTLMGRVGEAVTYEPGRTDMATDAAAALAQGAGVCQDHAHVLIAAARAIGIPARYVAGYYMPGDSGDLSETHGWAEGYVPDLGWVGFDAANGQCPTPAYVRVTSGLDASYATLVSGALAGQSEERMDASVAISQQQQ